jgi:hypothetical protein
MPNNSNLAPDHYTLTEFFVLPLIASFDAATTVLFQFLHYVRSVSGYQVGARIYYDRRTDRCPVNSCISTDLYIIFNYHITESAVLFLKLPSACGAKPKPSLSYYSTCMNNNIDSRSNSHDKFLHG